LGIFRDCVVQARKECRPQGLKPLFSWQVERAKPEGLAYLDVRFQGVVVHSVENWEADVAKQEVTQETEWTITIMLD
ncbi:MAG: hypothetical protein ABI072_08135, partial [Edaphobacter sp.]